MKKSGHSATKKKKIVVVRSSADALAQGMWGYVDW